MKYFLTLSRATSHYCTTRAPLERATSHYCTTGSRGLFTAYSRFVYHASVTGSSPALARRLSTACVVCRQYNLSLWLLVNAYRSTPTSCYDILTSFRTTPTATLSLRATWVRMRDPLRARARMMNCNARRPSTGTLLHHPCLH